jgi:hypothetical protein
VPDILPVGGRGDADVAGDGRSEAVGNGEEVWGWKTIV